MRSQNAPSRLRLLVEILLEGRKLVLSLDTAFPPGLKETEAIAHQLDEGGGNTFQADDETMVFNAGINEDKKAVEHDGCPRKQGHPIPCVPVSGVVVHHGAAESGDEDQQDDTHGEHHRQQMDELHGARMTLLQVDAGDAAVVDLPEELAEVSSTLVPYPCFGK